MKSKKAKATRKSKPTIRQMIAVRKLSEIIRKSKRQKGITIGRILREAGYSESVAKSPQRVTERKGWQELMSKHFPNENIAKLHKELLNKKEVFVIDKKVVYGKQPHSDTKGVLDMTYKLKGKYSKERIEHSFDKELQGFFEGIKKDLPK